MPMRVCLIGAGDIEYHYFNLLRINEEGFREGIKGVASALVDADCELILLPARGVSLEVAKEYKRKGGKKVVGTVPFSDKDFGIKHLEQYMEATADGKRVFDEFIDTGNWYKQDLIRCILGDVVLVLGISLGSLGELCFGFYLYKLLTGCKPVKASGSAIHPEIRAGKNVRFSAIIYEPFTRGRLNYEIEEYIKRLGGRIYYVKNKEELKNTLIKIRTKKI